MADNSTNDELVSQFMAFTGSSDPSRAASYLEMSGGDLQTAVGLYMEHEQTPSAGITGGAGASSGDGFGAGGLLGDEDVVRAPDETRRMQLMDDRMMHHHHMIDPSMHLMNAMMEEQFASAFEERPRSSSSGRIDPRGAVNAAAAAETKTGDEDEDDDQDYNYDDDDEDENAGGGNDNDASTGGVARLSDMFAAPTHLIHSTGGFQGSRAAAKDAKRWLLVNIQRDAEFASHALNRDVWRDELVENLVRAGFIFWQQPDTTTEGRTYVERYQVADFPHIGIIDPRTGRLLWRKEGWTQENPVTAETFAEMAMDFCSRNSFDRPPQAPRPGGPSSGSFGSAAGASMTQKASQKRPVQEMTEDEQMAAAMRASMENVSTSVNGHGTMESNGEVEVVDVDAKPAAREPSMVDELLAMVVADEPAKGARLQLRMPDGKRIVRRFAPSDPIRIIYAFVAQSNDEAQGGREFVLMSGFPPDDLIHQIDKTIEECGLAGQAITVRWKE